MYALQHTKLGTRAWVRNHVDILVCVVPPIAPIARDCGLWPHPQVMHYTVGVRNHVNILGCVVGV